MKSSLLKVFIFIFSVLSLNLYSQSLGNNTCATAVSIPTTGVCVTGNNTTATATGDGGASCFTVENGVWFKFVAPTSGVVNITTNDIATNFNSQLTLFSGTCGSLSEMACNDNISGSNQNALISASCLVPGQTYYVMLDGYAGATGTFCVKITTVTNPLNDLCSCATNIPINGSCLTNQTTVGATDNWTGVVGCQSADGHGDVWYTFVADSSSVKFTVTSGTMGGNVEMVLASANSCSSTFSTNATYCSSSVSSNTFLNLTIGATYYLTISSTGAAGTFSICGLSSTPPPVPGQNCSTAAFLCSDASFGQASSTAGFGIQEVTPSNSCWGSGGERQSRWYKFTVGATGTLGFEIKPNVISDDYDWALWDITTAGCPTTLSATPDAIACNWYGTTNSFTDVEGSTGLSTYTTAADICAFQSGATDQGNPGCVPLSFLNYQNSTWGPISVEAGHTYAILIDNFSTSNNGFSFDFAGTAHIGPVADFITLKSCTTASLISAPSASNTAYNWNYGDGSTSTTSYSVTHTYTASGTYSISLGVTDALGCTAAYNDVLNIGNPSLVVSPTETICAGNTATLLATAIPNNPQLTFSNTTAVAIPDNNTTGVSSTVTVSGIAPATISTNQMVKVCLNITHTWDADLDIVLTCPSGNTVILTSDNGGSGDNYGNTCFTGLISTDVAAGIAPAVAPFNTGSGYYSPESSLTALNSCNINGNWVLNIKDDLAGESGILNSWSMTFNSTSNAVTYSWTPSGTLSSATSSSPTASPTTTTIYTVTAIDLQGCTSTGTTQVVVNPLPTPTITSTNTLCLGSSLTFTGTGASTYTWSSIASGNLSSTNGSTVSATPTSTGSITYSLSVTGVNSCTNTATKTITVNPIPTANAGSSATLTCSSPTISLSGSGGGTYSWSGPGIVSGSTTSTPSINAPGIYSLVVTSAFNCSSPIATVSISQNTTTPLVSVSSNTSITCAAPTVTLTGSAAPSTATPVWSGGVASGANSYTATASSANVYTLTVTNPANGCSAAASVTVSPSAGLPVVSTAVISNSITCSLATAQVTLSSTPAGNTYSWSGPSVTSGGTSSVVTVGAGGTYSAVVTNTTSACSSSITVFVPTNTTAPTPTATTNGTLTCNSSSLTVPLSVSPSSGLTYTWTGTGITSGGSTATPTVNLPGTFTVAVTNTVNGCSNTANTTVTQNTVAPSVTGAATSSLNCTTSTVNISATTSVTPVTYNWSGTGITSATNISTITVNQGGSFTYTVTNTANSCITINTLTVIQNTTIPVVIGATSGSLNCTVLSVNASATTSTTPVSYNWSGTGITSATNISTISVNQGGTFTYTVTNTANNCTATNTVSVIQNTVVPLLSTSSSGSLTCTTTTASINISTTASPVSYTWTGTGITSATTGSLITVNQPGNFNYTVTNTFNNCKVTGAEVVDQNTVTPSVVASNTGSLNCTISSIDVVATTTVTPVTYNWSGAGITAGAGTATISVNQGGTYNYTVTNTDNNCKTIGSQAITQNTIAPSVAGANTGSLNCTTTTVNVSATTTATPVSYNWSGPGITAGAGTGTITVSQGGTYNYTVTNTANTCSTTGSQAITQNTTAPIVTGANTGSLNCTTTTVNVSATTTTTPVSYNWSGTGITSAINISTITVNQGGTFNYTVTNTANNCTATGSQAITQNTTAPIVTAANTGSLNCTTTTINVSATTTTTPVSYNWSGAGITSATNISTITVNQAGTFNFTVTNTTNNCKSTGSQSITQNTISPTVTGANTGSLNCTVLTVSISATTSATPVSYNWSGTGITSATNISTITVNQPGTFNYTVTNTANNCTTTGLQSIIQNTVIPTVTMPASQTITCAAPTVTMIASANPSTCTPVWTGGVASGVNSYTAAASSANIYTLTVTNPFNGCVNSGTTQVSPSAGFPSVTTSVTNSLSCTVTSAQVVATTTSSPVTYNWSGPGITSGATTTSASVNAPGQYTVVVTNTLSLCSSTLTIGVIQNTVAPIVTGATSGTLSCSTLTVNASATTTTTPVSYVWSGTGITGGSGTGTIAVNQPGNFNYTVTNTSNGCFTTGIQAVTQNTAVPVIASATSGTLTCATLTVNASATTTTTPVSYTWTGAGITSAANISTITVNQPGVYNYTVTNTLNNCITSGTQTVIQNTVSPNVTGANTGSLNCTTTTVNVTASTTVTPVSYNWSGPGITAGIGTGTISVNLGGTYNYTVTNTTNNCTTVGSQAITQNTVSPIVSGANTGSLNCVIASVNASATTSTTPVSYNWTGPSITAGSGTGTITVNQGGTYNYTVTNTANNCVTIGSQAITQNTTAPTSTATTSGSITCVTNTVNLNSSLAGMNYTWTAPSGSSILSGGSLQNAVGQGLGNYTLTLLNSANSCTFQTSVAAIQNTTTPSSVDAGPNKTLVCITPTVSLQGSATPTTSLANWLGGVSNPTVFVTSTGAAGVYTLQAIEPTTGCFITDTVRVIQSVNSPTVTSNPVTNSITCTNSVVTIGISVSSPDPVTISWPTGTGISGPTNTTTATATLTGVYQVTVTNTFNSCISINSINVPINITPVSVSVTPATTITCALPTQTLNASPVGSNYTYTWTGSGITSGGSTPNPVVNTGGNFTVAVTNTINGCASTGSVNVPMDISTPTVNISTASYTTTCASPNASLSITSTPTANVTYSWTAPSGGSLDNYTVSNPVTSGSGIFTVVVTNTVNGCSSSLTQNTVEIIPDAAIPNISLSSNSVAITCSDPTPSVTISTTTTPVSYSWTPISGIVAGTETSATPSFSLNGTYSVVVTNTASGCATSLSSNVVTVSLDNTFPVISLSSATNDGTITCTNTFVVVTPTITPSASNLTYSWSPGAGISTPVNQSSATFTAAGVYTLVVTNTLTGCVNTSTTTANTFTVVEDNIAPTFSLGTASSVTTTCSAPNATLSASSSFDPNTMYTWTTPSSTTLTGSPIVVSTSGIYTIVVTNTLNGCSTSSASSQATVEVVTGTGIPSVSMSINTLSITCSNPTVSATASTTSTPVSYSWSPTTGIIPGTETTASPSFTAAGSYSVVVTNTASGCASSITSNVVTVTANNAAPVITLSSATNDGTITCPSPAVTITVTPNPASNDLTYSWLPSANVSTNQTAATFTAAGVYTLVVTNTLTGCVTSSTNSANTFTVYGGTSSPSATITAISTNSTIGCGGTGSFVTLSAATVTTNLISWLPGGSTQPTLTVTSAGIYSLVTVDAITLCSDTRTFTVSGNTLTPQNVDAGTSANIACGSSSVILNGVSSSTNVNFSWSGPSSTSILSGSNTSSPVVAESGTYVLTVTDNSTGCQSTASVVVSQANVTAAFTADPVAGLSPLTVNFTDASTGATNWSWNFGDANSAVTQNPTNVYTTGSYTVTLTASSGSCTATATVVIVVEDALILEIPNVFTPNGDGSNDVFSIKSTGVKEISLQIFNRWGEKLYEFSGPKASWDGLAPNGLTVPEGTYFYFVKAKGFDGTEIEKHGSVNLFR
ncbi:MAG: gliding motility-associated C-terminal domain-containing protein [Burkholderiales bacterium]|nr:gliding motility-associated C-terminal domain-containing protein [Bacteroidia bacterium]